MPRSGRTQDQVNNLAHRQYITWAKGDGAKTEFAVLKRVLRLDDLLVFVSGSLQQPSAGGVANSYSVRGLTPGYSGDATFVKFAVAPPVNAAIAFIQNAD